MTAASAATRPTRLTTPELLGELLDCPLRSWDVPAGPPPRHADNRDYRRALAEARARTGLDESIITGEGRLEGRRVAVIAGEFGFLAGSIGTIAARRITDAVERATAEQLPLLGITASGGTRMQEGTPAFLTMAGIAAAIAEHKHAGLPYITYLRHPTTGGVLASWGSLGNITLAEPDALIGFLGPKVYAALHGEPFPPGIQRAEHLYRHGVVDAVVPTHELRSALRTILGLVQDGPPTLGSSPFVHRPADRHPEAWACVTETRDAARPGLRQLLEQTTAGVTLVHDRPEGAADGTLLTLARVGRTSCVLFGHDREAQQVDPSGPAALRLAQRAMSLARDLRLPLVTVIDTPGTALSPAAEEQGTAREIARCLETMARLEVPTVSVILGQGAGGAALAILPADRVVAAKHAWITPLPPEGASTILHGHPYHAADTVERMSIRAIDLLRQGAVDVVVDDQPSTAASRLLTAAVEAQLQIACSIPATERRAFRRRRWRG
jgi:acyl-CoA carboxylase subunit beta